MTDTASVGDAHSHFGAEAAGEPAHPGRFVNVDAMKAVEFVPGLGFRPVLGDGALVNFVSFEPNTEAPKHVHSEEQIVIVVDGEFSFDLDGDVRVMRRGDVCVVPPWVPHGARTGDGTCLEIDVFVPPRQSLLNLAAAAEAEAGGAAAGDGGEG